MTDTVNISTLDAAHDIAVSTWDKLANPAHLPFDPFLTHSFFHALEESGSVCPNTGWRPMHLIAKNDSGKTKAIMPLYLKGHSRGEYVFDQGWAQGYEMAGGHYYPKLISCVPFTPVTGRRIFTKGKEQSLITKHMINAVKDHCIQKGLSSFHCNFIDPALASHLQEQDCLLRQDTQFHWQDKDYETFDGFLASLQSRKRKALKKERRAALEQGLKIKWIEGDDITPAHWDAFYNFYQDTGARKWGTPYLTRMFFDMIGQTLKSHIVLIFAYQDDIPVAGALNMKGSDALYGRYWGTKGHYPFLHFEVCYYQAIDYALANGLSRVEAGAQGEHKLLRGYAPSRTLSAHYIANPNFKRAVAGFLENEGHHVDMRNDILNTLLPFKKQ